MAYRISRAGSSLVPSLSVCNSKLICRHCHHNQQNHESKRKNPLGIQMLSDSIHRQLFKDSGACDADTLSPDLLDKVFQHLKEHDLFDKEMSVQPEVDFQLPHMKGDNLTEHIQNITMQQVGPYVTLADKLYTYKLPPRPSKWQHAAGWHRYNSDGSVTQVDYPTEEALVFDIETYVRDNYPVMATAVSDQAWYSWCSERLIDDKFIYSIRPPRHKELISMESSVHDDPQRIDWVPRFILGHNVGYDRSYIREQYFIKGSKMRFFDTMSMHVAIHGFTSFQRVLFNAQKTGKNLSELKEKKNPRAPRKQNAQDFDWMKSGTVNNLNDVFQYHCKDALPLDKSSRDIFVKGSIELINKQFQKLMTYCSQDVIATHRIYQQLWPKFRGHFPNPVTFAGMLEMSTAYLPVNNNWNRYLEVSEQTFNDSQNEISTSLSQVAADMCNQYADNENHKNDPWAYDLDWSKKDIKILKKPRKNTPQVEDEELHPVVRTVLNTSDRLPKSRTHMPGLPKWYSDLHPREKDPEWRPGPAKLTTSVRVTPKLLKLRWEGYPLFYHEKHGWGYVVPTEQDEIIKEEEEEGDVMIEDFTVDPSGTLYPYKEAREIAYNTPTSASYDDVYTQLDNTNMSSLIDETFEKNSLTYKQSEAIWSKVRVMSEHQKQLFFTKYTSKDGMICPQWHAGVGPIRDVKVRGGWFYKLPHKNGERSNVGNPLSKDFLSEIGSGMLTSSAGSDADRVLRLSIQGTYWKNARDRIMKQMVVSLDHDSLPEHITEDNSYNPDGLYGAILPRIVVAGTVTRRGVERTWLTASNAKTDRIGSELKAMIQSPPGYHFVGADVDSQELWIASLLGDAHFAAMHGCTALGWMALQGKKSDGTDLHSKTANLIGISRDEAKVFNYGRIYGAGKLFAEKLLLQFNRRLGQEEAKRKAKVMYQATKGVKQSTQAEIENSNSVKTNKKWVGGSESEMFNWLEETAISSDPRTPVLRCKITKALQPENVHDGFMTSRINWVIQSSAVDYLHLMLVCMRWLFDEYNIDGRFCISIHDEVRYLVKSEDRYRASLALHITNLYTRAMFTHKIGINDLPQSVAFFSAVDIDQCLRKETTMDCKTPSNLHGIHGSYHIPQGETLDIYQILDRTGGGCLT